MREEFQIVVRGAGDIATGTIHRLHRCGFSVLALETERPSAIRRYVAFSETVYEGSWTIEGVEAHPELARIQKAFVDYGAVQCGFCSPGMIMSTVALLQKNPKPTEKEIRRGLSGNICRCTGYQAMVDAIQSLA